MRPIETGFNDSLTERIHVWHQKLSQLAGKEVAPLTCALFINIHPTLKLFFNPQKDTRNH